MSACISSQGEYSDHIHDGGEFVCSRCFVFDEYGALKEIANARHDADQAVAIERNMTATWLDKLGDDEMWADIATRYHLAAKAIRNGEHVKP